jgi:hypothetical protein
MKSKAIEGEYPAVHGGLARHHLHGMKRKGSKIAASVPKGIASQQEELLQFTRTKQSDTQRRDKQEGTAGRDRSRLANETEQKRRWKTKSRVRSNRDVADPWTEHAERNEGHRWQWAQAKRHNKQAADRPQEPERELAVHHDPAKPTSHDGLSMQTPGP